MGVHHGRLGIARINHLIVILVAILVVILIRILSTRTATAGIVLASQELNR